MSRKQRPGLSFLQEEIQVTRNLRQFRVALATAKMKKARPTEPKEDDNNNNNTQTARTHTVTDGARVEGLDGEIKFFSKRYVSFTAIGAGTEDSAPYVKGDERWIPVYWKFPGSDSTHTTWSIGGKNGKGIQPSKGASTQDFQFRFTVRNRFITEVHGRIQM